MRSRRSASPSPANRPAVHRPSPHRSPAPGCRRGPGPPHPRPADPGQLGGVEPGEQQAFAQAEGREHDAVGLQALQDPLHQQGGCRQRLDPAARHAGQGRRRPRRSSSSMRRTRRSATSVGNGIAVDHVERRPRHGEMDACQRAQTAADDVEASGPARRRAATGPSRARPRSGPSPEPGPGDVRLQPQGAERQAGDVPRGPVGVDVGELDAAAAKIGHDAVGAPEAVGHAQGREPGLVLPASTAIGRPMRRSASARKARPSLARRTASVAAICTCAGLHGLGQAREPGQDVQRALGARRVEPAGVVDAAAERAQGLLVEARDRRAASRS